MTQEEQILMDMLENENMFDSVIDALNLKEDEQVQKVILRDMLEQQTYDYMEAVIWKHMEGEQLKHFEQFAAQSRVIFPVITESLILLQFAALYPDLVEKVTDEVNVFFQTFVDNYNKIRA